MNEQDFKNKAPRVALLLLGSGYRAMFFHLGAIWRLNEFGLLRKLSLISSVSGGSIVAGTLAARWRSLDFESNDIATNFETVIASILRDSATSNRESPWRIAGMQFNNIVLASERTQYRKLTEGMWLSDLPKQPEFIFNATNLQTGGICRFSRSIADADVGEVREPKLSLATVLAASAALPPQPPLVLKPASIGNWSAPPASQFSDPEFRNQIFLCDGSVGWDDLTAVLPYEILLVSDAGAVYPSEPHPGLHWLNSRFTALALSDVHIYKRRKRELSEAFAEGKFKGAYWDIARTIDTYGAKDALDCQAQLTKSLAGVSTSFVGIEAGLQSNLIDWGFASCDAAIRSSLVQFCFPSPDVSPNGTFYPNVALTGAATAA